MIARRCKVNTSISKKGGGAAAITIVIMMIYFMSPTISAISPAVASISSSYPAVSASAIGYVVTITAAFQAVTAVVAGALMGRKIKYRTLTIFSSALVVVSGCFPFLLQDGTGFALLLVSRALLGVGLGTIMPLSNALVLASFSDEGKRSQLIGAGNAMLNIGTIVTNLLGGFLCGFSWQSTFLVYALGVILVALSVFVMREPTHVEKSTNEKGRSGKLPLLTFVFIFFFLMMCVVTQSVVVYCSSLLADAGVTDSMVSATMVSVFSVGGIVISLGFSLLFKALHNVLLPAAYVVAALALLACFVGSDAGSANILLFGVGAALSGAALLIVTCFTPMAISQIVEPKMQSTAMGFVSFAMAGGTFLSTPFAQLAAVVTGDTSIRMVLLVGTVVSIALAVLACATIVAMKKREQAAEEN